MLEARMRVTPGLEWLKYTTRLQPSLSATKLSSSGHDFHPRRLASLPQASSAALALHIQIFVSSKKLVFGRPPTHRQWPNIQRNWCTVLFLLGLHVHKT